MSKERLTPNKKIVFPLDVPDLQSALVLAKKLKGHVGYFKIGLELFVSRGPEAVKEIKKTAGGEAGIFLDLKLHDIPATVGRAMARVADLGVDLVTVHAEGGGAMLQAAVDNAGQTKVLAITVLTSLDLKEELGLAENYRDPLKLVLLRARRAFESGCHGFVCSGVEAAAVRQGLGPDPLIVTPGIRPAWSLVSGDDQKRVVTPAMAMGDGADLLVIGRPIRDADDPAYAADKVAAEIEAAVER